ncbi:magnesium transporter [Pseudomonas syringae]|uniref:magnesium transporter n=1 Tax=Pseudomonas syringae TaxID=317 RepID=UPI0021808183|nr:magnesium transporter [Pseudomonas syringae]
MTLSLAFAQGAADACSNDGRSVLARTLEIARTLIGFPSVSDRSNLDLIEWVSGYLHGVGVHAQILPDASGRKANLFASLGPPRPGGIILSGHTDVVPVACQAWAQDPFSAHLDQDRLYGRGSSDMKGFIAVVLAMVPELMASARQSFHLALSYDEDQVGALMDFEMVTIREDVSLEVVLRYLRRLKELPGHTDKLFVVDSEGVLKGVLPIKRLLVNDPEKQVGEVMANDPVSFHPEDDAYDAAQAFERYDLISTPVVDKNGKLIGRLTIDEMVDLIREESESEVLNMAGLREEEDIFASVWRSLRNRWSWLAVNLVTAFLASRVIGLFEGSIEKLVALAALMPIVAGIGGNSGNQTITMIVRAMALDQVNTGNTARLLRKELAVGLINGLIWGGVIGVVAYFLYDSWSLGVVMTAAMTLNLLLAALMGVSIPMALARLGRDPAMGASVMITAMTDSGGFFIFLGLATIFLL